MPAYIRFTLCFFIPFLSIFPVRSQTLTVAVAANFRGPMDQIVQVFKKEEPNITVHCIYGSSGNLYHQIINNAPYDIFFSANMNYAEKLYRSGVTTGAPKVYAIGQLVLWSKDINLNKSGISTIVSPLIKKIAIANPDLAPYGTSAVECMKYLKLYDQVKSKLVIAENIAQAAQYASTGNSDAGFLAMSELKLPALQDKGTYIVIPAKSYAPIKQGVVMIKRKGNNAITSEFMNFMRRQRIEAIILSYGYKTGNL